MLDKNGREVGPLPYLGDPTAPYNPNFDPNIHLPEVNVPGLGNQDAPIVDHSTDPNWIPPVYPDEDAPVDPKQQYKNATGWQLYQIQVWLNGVWKESFGGDDLEVMRVLLLQHMIELLRAPNPPRVAIKILDTVRELYVDQRGNKLPDVYQEWVGQGELRVMAGGWNLMEPIQK